MNAKLSWCELRELGVQGQGWPAPVLAHPYDRLPARAEAVLPEAVWNLSRQSTGFWVDFRTNASALHARTVLRVPPFEHQAYIKYLDLYARGADGSWRWAGVSRNGFVPSGQTPLVEGLTPEWRTFRLYLPLFYVIERLELGVPPDASLESLPPPAAKPLVVYGTSIVHGHSASRPGMAWPSILGRRLARPVINLGFSGSARMEPDLGRLLAELDAALLVVDPLPNMSRELVEQNTEPFLGHLLAAHPRTPLLLVEDRAHAQEWLYPGMRRDRLAKRAAFRAVYERLCAGGARNLAYVEGDPLLGADAEATVDGSHPSDLGFVRYADALEPAIAGLVRTGAPPLSRRPAARTRRR